MRHLSTQGQGFSPALNSNALADFCRCHSLQEEYTKRAHVSQPWQRCSSLRLGALCHLKSGLCLGRWNLLHKHTHPCLSRGVLQSLCNREPGWAALCLTICRLRPSFRPRFCVSFGECSGRLGTVDFGGQVKAVILFLNAICSQAGTEPLRGAGGVL